MVHGQSAGAAPADQGEVINTLDTGDYRAILLRPGPRVCDAGKLTKEWNTVLAPGLR